MVVLLRRAVRVVGGLGDERSYVRGLREWNLQQYVECDGVRGMDHVRGGRVHQHGGQRVDQSLVLVVSDGHVRERDKPGFVYFAHYVRRRYRADGRGHLHRAASMRSLRVGHLLRGRHGCESRLHRRDVGSRRQLRDGVRGESHVHGGPARRVERLGDERSHLHSLRKRHLHDDDEPSVMHGVDNVRRRRVREHGGHDLDQSSLHGVPERHVFERE
jgi:hypothetical protein